MTLPALDSALLTGPVRRALRSESAQIGTWRCRPISYAHTDAVTSGLFRVSGIAQDGSAAVSWSLVLKIVRAQDGNDDPALAHYWKREVLAYQSGLLDDLPGGLVAPRCAGIMERLAGEAWLWLEDVTDTSPSRWPPAYYGTVGRRLGRFNGEYLAARPLPADPGLRTAWLRAYLARNASAIARLADDTEHPLLRRVYPAPIREGIVRLWTERDTFLAALRQRIPSMVLNGHPTERLPNNINLSFPGLDAETLLLTLDRAGISASSGSACTSGSIEPSHILTAMGLPDDRVNSAIRLTLGRDTTRAEVDRAVDILAAIVMRQTPSQSPKTAG